MELVVPSSMTFALQLDVRATRAAQDSIGGHPGRRNAALRAYWYREASYPPVNSVGVCRASIAQPDRVRAVFIPVGGLCPRAILGRVAPL